MAKTRKVSVALRADALAAAKTAAASEGLSLSGLLTKLLDEHFARQARFVSMDRFLTEYAPKVEISERDIQAIKDEMTAPLKPVRRSRRGRAA